MAMAAMYAALPRCPVMAVSASPRSGTVMLLMMDGMAMERMRLCTVCDGIVVPPPPLFVGWLLVDSGRQREVGERVYEMSE